MSRNVAVIVGSLRKESFSRKIATALIPLSKPALDLKLIEIGDLELYNEDTEKNPTPAWAAFRDAVRPADA
ncbi:MAG TPA: NAD(P)H-dependent oxidoreductase, partial [Rhizomicrobium sp.]